MRDWMKQAGWPRAVITGAALAEYAGLVLWTVYVFLNGLSGAYGDVPLELWLIPINLAAMAASLSGAYVVFWVSLRLADDRGLAATLGTLSAFLAPLVLASLMFTSVLASMGLPLPIFYGIVWICLYICLLFVPGLVLFMRGMWMLTGALRRSDKARVVVCLRQCCLALAAVVLIPAVYFVYMLSLVDWELPSRAPSKPSLAYISKKTSLRFPTSAVLLNSDFEKHFNGSDLGAKVAMDPADAGRFLKSFPGPSDTSQANIQRDLANFVFREKPIPSWWDPGSARKFAAVARFVPSVGSLAILIRTDDTRRAIVYVYWAK
ncbi:MAG: hypothetical protein M1133_14405 [Armatimonadetes bacterium]|nr:hypothetical protein [Armatimonadota bacterium]